MTTTEETSLALENAKTALSQATATLPDLNAAVEAAEDAYARDDSAAKWEAVEQARDALGKGEARANAAQRELARATRAHQAATIDAFEARRKELEAQFTYDGLLPTVRPLAERALAIAKDLEALGADVSLLDERSVVARQQWEQLHRGHDRDIPFLLSANITNIIHAFIFHRLGRSICQMGTDVSHLINPFIGSGHADPYAEPSTEPPAVPAAAREIRIDV